MGFTPFLGLDAIAENINAYFELNLGKSLAQYLEDEQMANNPGIEQDFNDRVKE